MTIRTPLVVCAVALAAPAFAAPAVTGRDFAAKAGAGDAWELKEAAMMTTSTNSDIVALAKRMTDDHTQSTAMVKAAAKADGIAVRPPTMTAKQSADLAALSASKGAARDALYITQQKAAHADALALMQGYATSGKATHLKAAAAKIAPVVQEHLDMLDKMALQ